MEFSYLLDQFLFLGSPTLRSTSKVSPSFAFVIPKVNMTLGLGSLEAVQIVGSKEARKAFYATVQSKRPPPNKGSQAIPFQYSFGCSFQFLHVTELSKSSGCDWK